VGTIGEPQVTDVTALRMREATIAAGILITYAVAALGALYVAFTWQRPHRLELALLFAGAAAAGAVVSLLPRQRIVRSRMREPFFLAWTMLDFALLIVATLLDGGGASPLVLVFFLPVVFSSMSYPLGSVVTVGVVSITSYLTVAVVGGGADGWLEITFVSVLACTACLSGWQARNHKRQHDALANASRTDPLTGCLNRRGFEERATAEVEAGARHGEAGGALLLLDIDHFKPVNDRFGHAVGDELLCWVALTLKSSVRPGDWVGRLGGDEFAVMLPQVSAEQAGALARRLDGALRERAPASFGVAVFPADGSSLEQLARVADSRLYASRADRPRHALAGATAAAGPQPAPPLIGAALDCLPTRVAVLDEAGTILAVNAAWRDAAEAGEDPGLTIGESYLEGCSQHGAEVAAALAGVLDGAAEPAELECRGDAGRRLRIRLRPCRGPGRARAVVSYEEAQGTSSRHELERRTVQEALFDQVDAAVIVTDPDGRALSWNAGAEALYGWTRAEAVGRDVKELIVPDDQEPIQQLIHDLRRDSRWDGEFCAQRKDGSHLTVYIRNRLIAGEDGEPVAIVGVGVDITHRVAAERAVLRARNYARAVTDAMGEGLFTVQGNGRISYANRAAEQMLGWAEGTLLGRTVSETIRPTAGAEPPCPILRTLRDGGTVQIDDDAFAARDGRELPVAYTASRFDAGDGVHGCVVIFQDVTDRRRREDENRRDAERLACLNRVEEALAEERFELHAQPIVDLGTGATIQHELLLRMRERDGRIVAPGEFLPVAEQYALVGEIDWWVIKRAAQIAGAGCPVELNVSARSIGDLDVLEHIERSIRQSGVPAGTLVFEITETAIVEDLQAAKVFTQRLREHGCRIALDDFGTGYGGLTYLKQLPVDYLKIDIEFVRDLATNTASQHVVQAVVALARDFALQTVAEGVEDEATIGLLRELGVDFAQGYAFARPAPFAERPDELARSRQEPARNGHRPRRSGARPRAHAGRAAR
jgi:diguanylate cyclase (GGDEF)-like protein/PAS domain S-box-containing protein